jgi:hypothetical protein
MRWTDNWSNKKFYLEVYLNGKQCNKKNRLQILQLIREEVIMLNNLKIISGL